eukprot:3673923-Amphidinium_carterae.1
MMPFCIFLSAFYVEYAVLMHLVCQQAWAVESSTALQWAVGAIVFDFLLHWLSVHDTSPMKSCEFQHHSFGAPFLSKTVHKL